MNDPFKFTTCSLKLWTIKFIIKHPIFSLRAYWIDLEEGY